MEPEAKPPRNGAQLGDQSRRGGVGDEAGERDRPDVGGGRGGGRRRPRPTALRPEGHRPSGAPAARPGRDPHGTGRAGVTLELLHLEYLQQHPDGYRYSAFCVHYRDWVEQQRRSMRQVHKAGDKLFVDYSGKKPELVDPATGVVRPVELFVAVLGASNYTYAEATETQRSADFIQSHSRTLEYLGGAPGLVVPDQLKTGVRAACRYEPILQRTYEEWAGHYQTAILPARPAKPRDKAYASHCTSWDGCDCDRR
jgi:hypothetical protein